MLKAICVVSANDCCVAMAEYLAGSQELFVEQMNKRAKELGMNDTCFKNCHGIDEDGHLTSSNDIAIMSRELIENFNQDENISFFVNEKNIKKTNFQIIGPTSFLILNDDNSITPTSNIVYEITYRLEDNR